MLGVAVMVIVVLATSKTTVPPVNNPALPTAEEKSNQDIKDAIKAVINCTAVSITPVSAVSPYDGKEYVVGHPCHVDWLVSNRGWDYRTVNAQNNTKQVTIMPYTF